MILYDRMGGGSHQAVLSSLTRIKNYVEWGQYTNKRSLYMNHA